MDAIDRTGLANSRLYSKFRSHADMQSLASLIGTRWQEIETTIRAIDSTWRVLETTTPAATQNDVLTKVASLVGYTRGGSETDASVVLWATRWAKTITSWGNLEDILYAAGACFTSPMALAANEVGPAPSGVYGGLMQVYIEDADFTAPITDIYTINKVLELLYSIAEAGSTVSLGFNLTQPGYLQGGQYPTMYRGGRRQVSLSGIVGTFNVGNIVTDTLGAHGIVLEYAGGGVLLCTSFDTMDGTLTGPSGSGTIGSQVVITDGPLMCFDGFKVYGTGTVVLGETVTGMTSGDTGVVTGIEIGRLSLAEITGVWTTAENLHGSVSGDNCYVTSYSETTSTLDNGGMFAIVQSPIR